MTTLIEEYLNYIKNIRSYSDNTISGYQNELAKFQNYLEEHRIDFKKITKDEIWEYLKYLDTLKYSNTSISRHISALRSLYNYLKQKQILFLKADLKKVYQNENRYYKIIKFYKDKLVELGAMRKLKAF